MHNKKIKTGIIVQKMFFSVLEIGKLLNTIISSVPEAKIFIHFQKKNLY